MSAAPLPPKRWRLAVDAALWPCMSQLGLGVHLSWGFGSFHIGLSLLFVVVSLNYDHGRLSIPHD